MVPYMNSTAAKMLLSGEKLMDSILRSSPQRRTTLPVFRFISPKESLPGETKLRNRPSGEKDRRPTVDLSPTTQRLYWRSDGNAIWSPAPVRNVEWIPLEESLVL